MKRYLLLFCTVVLIGVLIAVPAFASELQTYEAQISDGAGGFGSRIAPGSYVVTLTINGEVLPLEDDLLIVTGQEDEYFEFVFDVDGSSYCLRITLCGNDAWCEYLLDDFQVQGTVGLCRVGSPSVPDPKPDRPKPLPGSIVGSITGVFGQVGSWIVGQLGAASGLFWSSSSGSLTFLGVLAVVALAFAVIFLIIGIIQRFLHFRG